MSELDYNWQALLLLASTSTPTLNTLKRLVATSYDDQLALVEEAVDWCCSQLIENRHLKQELKEDQLTIEVVHMLKGMGYDADHDTQVGGHCDIVIRGRKDFLWIAEAKIHGAYAWLLEGFDQLSTRYSTGQPGQDTGDFLIFVFGKSSDKVLTEWSKVLEKERPDVAREATDGDAQTFYSTHNHANSGRSFRVRHKAVGLYWKPKA